jgi:hypothetical protein
VQASSNTASAVIGSSNSGSAITGLSTSNYGGDFAGGRAPIVLRAATTAGPPTANFHITGELFVDAAGKLFFCMAAGTPGTWKQVVLQ